jgi:predicted nucleotidyltransferase
VVRLKGFGEAGLPDPIPCETGANPGMLVKGGMQTMTADKRQGMEAKQSLSEETLQEIIRRVVEVARPEKIILFGSAARGEMGANSDVDLLVVKGGVHRRRLAMEIYRNLTGVGCAMDVIVVSPDDIERYGNCPALIIEPALQEGRVVYAQ